VSSGARAHRRRVARLASAVADRYAARCPMCFGSRFRRATQKNAPRRRPAWWRRGTTQAPTRRAATGSRELFTSHRKTRPGPVNHAATGGRGGATAGRAYACRCRAASARLPTAVTPRSVWTRVSAGRIVAGSDRRGGLRHPAGAAAVCSLSVAGRHASRRSTRRRRGRSHSPKMTNRSTHVSPLGRARPEERYVRFTARAPLRGECRSWPDTRGGAFAALNVTLALS